MGDNRYYTDALREAAREIDWGAGNSPVTVGSTMDARGLFNDARSANQSDGGAWERDEFTWVLTDKYIQDVVPAAEGAYQSVYQELEKASSGLRRMADMFDNTEGENTDLFKGLRQSPSGGTDLSPNPNYGTSLTG